MKHTRSHINTSVWWTVPCESFPACSIRSAAVPSKTQCLVLLISSAYSQYRITPRSAALLSTVTNYAMAQRAVAPW